MHGGVSSSLCSRKKPTNFGQISVCGKRSANHSWTAQRRFAVLSTHTRIYFANHLRAVCKPFTVLVYTRLRTLHLQASADAVLSCKPVQPVTRCGCGYSLCRTCAQSRTMHAQWYGTHLRYNTRSHSCCSTPLHLHHTNQRKKAIAKTCKHVNRV